MVAVNSFFLKLCLNLQTAEKGEVISSKGEDQTHAILLKEAFLVVFLEDF